MSWYSRMTGWLNSSVGLALPSTRSARGTFSHASRTAADSAAKPTHVFTTPRPYFLASRTIASVVVWLRTMKRFSASGSLPPFFSDCCVRRYQSSTAHISSAGSSVQSWP